MTEFNPEELRSIAAADQFHAAMTERMDKLLSQLVHRTDLPQYKGQDSYLLAALYNYLKNDSGLDQNGLLNVAAVSMFRLVQAHYKSVELLESQVIPLQRNEEQP